MVPDQDLAPWVAALEKIMTDREEYQSIQTLTATTATKWMNDMDRHAHEKWLLSMMEKK